jgi:hypothetical protein
MHKIINTNMKTKFLITLTVALLCLATRVALADPTAFELAKAGNDYLGIQSKDKVVEIRSDKTEKFSTNLTPTIWYVVYYDPDASLKAVEVKFGGGKKMDVSHPPRLLEFASDEHKIFPRELLKIDSDRALEIAKSQSLLANIKLTSCQMKLEHGDAGPQWRITFWAAKYRNPSDEANIGVVILSATDGSIQKLDLHPKSMD